MRRFLLALPMILLAAALVSGCSSDSSPPEIGMSVSGVRYQLNATDALDESDVVRGIRKAGVEESLVPDFLSVTLALAKRESGGNPNAVNLFSSKPIDPVDAQDEVQDEEKDKTKAPDGAPLSAPRGYLQLIPAIFAANHIPSTSDNIYNVEANVAAAWTYISSKYSVDLSTGSGLYSFSSQYGIS